MFGFLNTTSAPSSTTEILSKGKIAVIFNLPDHESLLAAAMASLLLKEKAEVILSDIRDPLPESESYLWIGCGNQTSLSGYYADQLDRKDLATVFSSSVFIMRPVKERIELEDGLIFQVSDALEDAGVDSVAMKRWAIVSLNWFSSDLAQELVVPYYEVLAKASSLYTGDDVSLSEFTAISQECSESELRDFEQRQVKINKTIARKVRQIPLGDKIFHMVTGLSDDIYGILRRLSLAKKSILHLSMGSYGMVLYSDKPVDAERMKLVNALNLSPINK